MSTAAKDSKPVERDGSNHSISSPTPESAAVPVRRERYPCIVCSAGGRFLRCRCSSAIPVHCAVYLFAFQSASIFRSGRRCYSSLFGASAALSDRHPSASISCSGYSYRSILSDASADVSRGLPSADPDSSKPYRSAMLGAPASAVCNIDSASLTTRYRLPH